VSDDKPIDQPKTSRRRDCTTKKVVGEAFVHVADRWAMRNVLSGKNRLFLQLKVA
jgi:hypothetical protein